MGGLSPITVIAVRDGSDQKILLRYSPDDIIESLVKELPGVVWSEDKQCWTIPNNPQSLRDMFRIFRGKAILNTDGVFGTSRKQVVSSGSPEETTGRKSPVALLPQLAPEISLKVEEFAKWMKQRRYSESTIRTYCEGVRTFFRYHHNKALELLSNADLEDFNYGFVLKHKYSGSYQNQVINAVKLFFKKMEKRVMNLEEIERPRKEEHLPNVLSKEEVKKILWAPVNLKHRAMLSLIYACGLRRGELLNLKPADIASSRGLLIIRQSKGNKDRVVPIPEKLVEILRDYYKAYRPKEWLFEGQVKGRKYSSSSLHETIKKCVAKAGIRKPVSLHWLRHSYATHFLESGTDLRYIQELLGHKSSRTTEIYTHVSQKNIQQLRSPYDDL